jgi:capsular polysaccharide biosynthesis protein
MANDDAVTRLSWLLRHHAVLVVLSTLAFGVLGTVLQPNQPEPIYSAEALIVARDLDALRVEQLPRMAATVFDGGNVARRAVADGGLPMDPDDLIAENVSLEPIEGTLLLRVVGSATEADLAAAISNATADALTAELNRSGPSIAQFALQEAAVAPPAPDPEPRRNFTLIGAVAGLLVGLGLVALLATLRRPVLSVAALRDLVDAPVLPGPQLQPPGRPIDVVRTPGLIGVVKRFYPVGRERCAFIACSSGSKWRSQTALAVALLLARQGPVAMVASTERGAARLYRRGLSDPDAGLVKHLALVSSAEEAPPGAPLVLDGLSAGGYDVPQLLPPGATSILIVTQGTSAGAVEGALRQFIHGEITAVLFIPRTPMWRMHARQRYPAGAARKAPSIRAWTDRSRAAEAAGSGRERS